MNNDNDRAAPTDWQLLYRQMRNVAAGYSNHCEESGSTRRFEREFEAIEADARALVASPPGSTGRAEPALTEFVSTWLAFVEAARELDGEGPIPDDAYWLSFMGNGASYRVTYGQLRAALSLPSPSAETPADPYQERQEAQAERIRTQGYYPIVRPAETLRIFARAALASPPTPAVLPPAEAGGANDFDAWYADRLKPVDRFECLEAFRAGAYWQARAALTGAPDPLRVAHEPVAWIVTRLTRRDKEEAGRVRYLHLSEAAARSDHESWLDVDGSRPTIAPLYAALPSPLEKAPERDVHPDGKSLVPSSAGSPSDAGADAPSKGRA
jgi:hypothetical protein